MTTTPTLAEALAAVAARMENYDSATHVETSVREYLYLSSDAALSDAGHLLLQAAVLGTGIFANPSVNPRSLLMTASGFRKLLDACPNAASLLPMPLSAAMRWQPHPAADLNLTEPQRAGWLMHQLLHLMQQGNGVRRFGSLYVLDSGYAEWEGRHQQGIVDVFMEAGTLVGRDENRDLLALPEEEQLRQLAIKSCGKGELTAVISRDAAFLQTVLDACAQAHDAQTAILCVGLQLQDDGMLKELCSDLEG